MSNPQVDLSKAKPFVFELSFDAESMAERRRQKIAEREDAAAEQAAASVVEAAPSFSEDDLAAAKAQAYDEGRAAGLADASAQREAGLASILETVGAQVAGLHVHQDVANEKLAADLTELGRTVLSKILPHYIAKHGCEEVTSILSEGFSRLVHEDRISITVGPDVHEVLEPRIEAIAAKSGYDGRLRLVADPDMGAADIVVNWGDGRLERATDDIWNEIDATLESAIAGMRDYADKLEQSAPTPPAPAKSDDHASASAPPAGEPASAELPDVMGDGNPVDEARLVTEQADATDGSDIDPSANVAPETETDDQTAATPDETTVQNDTPTNDTTTEAADVTDPPETIEQG